MTSLAPESRPRSHGMSTETLLPPHTPRVHQLYLQLGFGYVRERIEPSLAQGSSRLREERHR